VAADLWVIALLLLVLGGPILLSLRRANEFFAIRVAAGRALHVRGRMPPRLFAEFSDVLERAKVDDVELRIVSEDRRPVLKVHGSLAEPERQRLRNLLGTYSAAQLRAGARRPARR
jgi:hypothetical protein